MNRLPLLFWILALTESADVIVLDNSGSTAAAHVSASSSSCGGHNGTFHHNNGQMWEEFMAIESDTFFEWKFNVTRDGCYLVENYIPDVSHCGLKGSPGVVPVRIDYCRGQSAQYAVDQSRGSNQWARVALLPFYVGHSARIALNLLYHGEHECPHGQCLWLADAFALTYLAADCKTAEQQLLSPQQHSAVQMTSTTAPAGRPEGRLFHACQFPGGALSAHICRWECGLQIFSPGGWMLHG